MDLTKGEVERFHTKYVKSEVDDCWEWKAALYERGYGMFCLRRGNRKTFLAHRIAWIIHNSQDIPPGHMICHRCDNPVCVNPNHLYCGTGYTNNQDTINRGRGNRKQGSQCSWSKLDEKMVIEILKSQLPNRHFAFKYGVDASLISQIRSGRRWGHLHHHRVSA
jgi:hypothetical protein